MAKLSQAVLNASSLWNSQFLLKSCPCFIQCQTLQIYYILSSKLNYLNPYHYKSESHNSLASITAILHSFCNNVFILRHAGS